MTVYIETTTDKWDRLRHIVQKAHDESLERHIHLIMTGKYSDEEGWKHYGVVLGLMEKLDDVERDGEK